MAIACHIYDGKFTVYLTQWGRGARHHLPMPKNLTELNLVLKRYRSKFKYLHEWEQLCKKLKDDLYEHRFKSWDDAIDPEIVKWLYKTINDHVITNDDTCNDNYRAACKSVSSQMRRYKRDRDTGCCGYYDKVVTCPIDNEEYLIGFNYGH